MAEETVITLRVVVAALDKDGLQVPGCDLGGSLLPDLLVPGTQGDAVGFDVAEDEDLPTMALVLDKVCTRVVDAYSLLFSRRGELAEETCCPGRGPGKAVEFTASGSLQRGGVVAPEAG